MSEYINNREYRKKTIKNIIKQLHEGKTVEEVKQQFEDAFEGVLASEITEVEGALIEEGLPISEVQRLCDVHASVFKGSIQEIHQTTDLSIILGHPANTIKRENREIERIIAKEIEPHLTDIEWQTKREDLVNGLEKLATINLHYQKKENLFFPYMEQYGITAPPKVMWGVDDEIRAQIKEVKALLLDPSTDQAVQKQTIVELTTRVRDMIFKEENIMLPMLLEHLTQEEWILITEESNEIGFMIDNVPVWKPVSEKVELPLEGQGKAEKTQGKAEETGLITLPTGVFHVEELTCMLNALPFDITFVNKEDTVSYFSQGKDRVFPRTKAIIGRNVSNCHPPASVHVVEQIVQDFIQGVKDQEEFWIKMGDKFILIRYYAVRNEQGEYLGVLEVTQDIKPIQEYTGEKRLMSE